jgi:hypothetical protein
MRAARCRSSRRSGTASRRGISTPLPSVGSRPPSSSATSSARSTARGRKAVAFWTEFDHTSIDPDAFLTILTYLSTQKLRTPKGLDWLAARIGSRDPAVTVAAVARFRMVFNARWAECVWQIADASGAETKFIVSDHPVTVYNRAYTPLHPEVSRFRRPRHPPKRDAHDLPALAGEGADFDEPLLGDQPLRLADEGASQPPVRARRHLQLHGCPGRPAVGLGRGTRHQLHHQEPGLPLHRGCREGLALPGAPPREEGEVGEARRRVPAVPRPS